MMGLLPQLCMALCVGLAIYDAVSEGPIMRLRRWYAQILAEYYAFLFMDRAADRDAVLHLGACAGVLVLSMFLGSFVLAMAVPVVAMLPVLVLEKRQTIKQTLISEQLAPWLTVLSNSLKSSPNISDALAASTSLVPTPLREEIDLLVKEVALGEHLDQAMQRSSKRLRSPLYSSVMTTLLVARKSGGDVSKVLDSSSDSLREMERLAGVVRTKTAEGKSQTFVLAILPFVMVGALQRVDPGMLSKLVDSSAGRVIVAFAIALWLGSVALAYRIVKVDI